MSDFKFLVKVFAVGFPSLLLVVGLAIYSGAAFVNMFVDASEQVAFGKGLIGFSILIYFIELMIYVIMWYSENYGSGN